MSDNNNASKQMSLREHYAGLAMQGILASCASDQKKPTLWVCEEAVEYADMLIEQLNKSTASSE